MQGIKRIKVGSLEVGLVGLDEIFKEIQTLGIKDENTIRDKLLEKAKLCNWIPKDREGEYKIALFSAYKTFCRKLDSERQND